MKRIILVTLLLLLSINICRAEDAIGDNVDEDNVFTDDAPAAEELHGFVEYNEPEEEVNNTIYLKEPININNINLSAPKKIGSKSLIPETKKPTFEPMGNPLETASKFYTDEYHIKPISASYSQNFGKLSFGTSYDTFLSSARLNNSTGLFAKYEGKHFALRTVYSKSANNYNNYYDDNFYIVPELKLTKRLSLLDIMQTDVYQINKSNELVLRYTPRLKKYADDVQLELGAGQSFYDNNFIGSEIRFSTRFKL